LYTRRGRKISVTSGRVGGVFSSRRTGDLKRWVKMPVFESKKEETGTPGVAMA